MQSPAQQTSQQTSDPRGDKRVSREHHHPHGPELTGCRARNYSPDQDRELSEEDAYDGRT
jgi:hypothetical protein